MIIVRNKDLRSLYNMLVMLLISYAFTNGYVVKGVNGTNIKFAHGGLASALNSRSNDFGTPGNAIGTSNGNLKTSNGSGGTGTYQAPAVTGGEVIVPKSFPLSPQEPTCEELRAMWIFSKRQSRAAEITNEIPTFRDPFTYNVWEPLYPSTRSMGTVRMMQRFPDRSRAPVFGRVISREPLMPQRVSFGQRQRYINPDSGSSRIYGGEAKGITTGVRRPAQNRYIGGSNGSTSVANGVSNPNAVSPQGSFQKLKELIWTERAKELVQQRRAEEVAAKAAVLKEITNGQNVQHLFKNSNFKSDSPLMDENRSPDSDGYQYLNDGRSNIATGQTQTSLKTKNSNSRTTSPSSTRSYGGANKPKILYKTSIFSENSNSGRMGRVALPNMHMNGYVLDDPSEDDYAKSATGVPKVFPMRSSHFRERNRAMFKQAQPSEYLARDIRDDTSSYAKSELLDRVLHNLNQQLEERYFNILAESNAYNEKLANEETFDTMDVPQIYGEDKDYSSYYEE